MMHPQNTKNLGCMVHRRRCKDHPRLQRGLDPKDKATRVYHYHHNLEKEVGIIAHSCGVAEPRQLRRHHARRIMENGHSVGLDELYQVEPK